MNKVLITDGSADFLNTFGQELNGLRQFEVLSAPGGREAIAALSAHRIDVVVTGLNLSDMDALDLLAYMSRANPETPCIVMTEQEILRFRTPPPAPAFLTCLGKPFSAGALASAILSGFNLIDSGRGARGMPMEVLLPLVNRLRKTGRMRIGAEQKGTGDMYFRDGILLDACCDRLTGEAAALEIATWDRIVFDFSKLPDDIPDRRIETELMEIVGAEWIKAKITPAEIPEEEIILLEDVVTIEAEHGPEITVEEAITLWDEVAEEAPEQPAGREGAERLLNKLLADTRHVKGYRGAAVINENGYLLAADSKDDALDWSRLAGELNCFLKDAAKTSDRIAFGPPDALTLHTAEGTLLVQQIEMEEVGRASIILFSSLQGNWYYFKIRLEGQKAKPAVARG